MSWNLVGRPRASCTGRARGWPARVMLSHCRRSLNVASVHQAHCVCSCTSERSSCASRIWSGASMRTATGRRVTGRPGIIVAAKAAPPSATIEAPSVVVEMADRNSRRLYAHIAVPACPSKVWQSLTDYDNLDDFIPGLAENECLERLPTGCILRQVGEQDVAFGASFRAAVTLTILEHRGGTPPQRLESIEQRALAAGTLLPLPRSPGRGAFDDITFELINGDFQAFRGVWRIQDGRDGPDSCLLAYAVVVKPQRWLPVRLIQGRIEREVKANLQAVAVHASEL